METTHGYYDGIAMGLNKTVKPMNIHSEFWKDLGYSRRDLADPRKNIRAGAKLLKRISNAIPNGDVAKIGSVYNSLDARHVNDYGARIKKLMKYKPWEK